MRRYVTVATRIAGFAPLLAALTCCSGPRVQTPAALDPEAAACIPPDAVAVAGILPRELRSTPLFARVRDLLPAMQESSLLLVSYNGSDLLVIARGQFSRAP